MQTGKLIAIQTGQDLLGSNIQNLMIQEEILQAAKLMTKDN